MTVFSPINHKQIESKLQLLSTFVLAATQTTAMTTKTVAIHPQTMKTICALTFAELTP